MTLKKAILVKLTICDCGYAVLDDSIRVGTEFVADMDQRSTLSYFCGHCHGRQPHISCIGVNSPKHPTSFRPLPLAMFRFEPLPADGAAGSRDASPEAK